MKMQTFSDPFYPLINNKLTLTQVGALWTQMEHIVKIIMDFGTCYNLILNSSLRLCLTSDDLNISRYDSSSESCALFFSFSLTVSLSQSPSGGALDSEPQCRGEYTQVLSSGGCFYTPTTAEGAKGTGETMTGTETSSRGSQERERQEKGQDKK